MKKLAHFISGLGRVPAQLKARSASRSDNVVGSLKLAATAAVERLEERALFSTYLVTTTADSGAGSLRQALTDANHYAGKDEIHFSIGSGAKTIRLNSPLPFINQAIVIDGTTQPGYAGKPLIEIDGSKAGSKVNGISVGPGNSEIRGLAITHFTSCGILLDGGNSVVAGNYIGVDLSGKNDAGNGEHGVIVISAGNRIGGTSDADHNVVSGNGKGGVFLYGGKAAKNVIQGNYIGTNAAGTAAIANGEAGVGTWHSWGNLIGGTADGAGNLISGNAQDGVVINGSGGDGNVIQGNLVGTDISGTKAIGNGLNGVEVNTANNIVGGTEAGARNVISGNLNSGVALWLKSSTGNRVQGNYLGTDLTGTRELGNEWAGLDISNGPSNNLIGGTSASERNIISGNHTRGVGIYSQSDKNNIWGNYIGTDVSGQKALGNWGDGVIVAANAGKNSIGGTQSGAGNVISANANGVGLSASAGTSVQGNLIGADSTGTRKLGNGYDGVWIGSSGNLIGGSVGNVIVNSGQSGVSFRTGSKNNVQGNFIGVNKSGAAMGNGAYGVNVNGGMNNALVSNEIAYSGNAGVSVGSGKGNRVSSNSIHDNAAQGINISWAGVNANDKMDGDTGGNNTQNFPVLSTAGSTSGGTKVTGTLQSQANKSYRIEFFSVSKSDTDGYGEGEMYLGFAVVKTNSSGDASFSVTLPAVASGRFISATATSDAGDTSEFSKALSVGGAPSTPPPHENDGGGTSTPTDPAPATTRYTATDSGFSGGTLKTEGFGDVLGTTEDSLYATRRFGKKFTFTKAVANGTYTVKLLMAEPWFTKTGQRKFSVTAEGKTILKNYDLVADTGASRAAVKAFTVKVTDGKLNLGFSASIDNAIISAIELTPA